MGARLGYRPALDGVRAISIALVLVFHLGAPWLPGGYLGVSVFFTLSGFLITSLLLHERTATGRIDIGAFYLRRLRRLLPASLLVLTGIAALAAVGAIAEREDLRSGVLGAVFQIANWERLAGDQSYADLFVAPSPVDHFWSLAIEEQFYWLWPIVIAVLTLGRVDRVRRALPVAFVLFGIAATVTAQVLGGDVAYFASWSRFAEILAGAALAATLYGRTVPRWASKLAFPALLTVLALSVVTPAGRGWAYAGGLPLFAVVSVALVLGVSTDGWVARALSREPIPWIGRVSYGLYLFHWPVFIVFDDESVALKLVATLALTVASYYVIERPIRTGRVLVRARTFVPGAAIGFVSAAASVAVLVPTVTVVTPSSEPVVLGAAPLAAQPAPPTSTIASASPNASSAPVANEPDRVTPTTAPAPPPPTVVAMFGDSVADWILRDAAASFARTDVAVVDAAIEGCDGAVAEPRARHRSGAVLENPDGCDVWTATYPRAVESVPRIDVAVLMVGNRALVDHEVAGVWVGPCLALDWYVADLRDRIAWLQAKAEKVVVVLPSWGGRNATFFAPDDHLVRSACVRDAIAALATAAGAPVVDLADLLCPAGPTGECADLRPDGLHVRAEDAPGVLEWLLDEVLAS